MFFQISVYAGITVKGYDNLYLSKPTLSVSNSLSKTVSVTCYSNSNIDNSLVAVAFFKKNSWGYSKLTAYDIDIKRKKSNTIVFSHTVKSDGTYKVFCVEAYDLNGDKKFSADEIEISKSKIITVGSSNSDSSDSNNDALKEPKVFVYDKGDHLLVSCNYMDTKRTPYGSGKVYVVLNGKEYLMPSFNKPVIYKIHSGYFDWYPTTFVSFAAEIYPTTKSNSISCKIVKSDGSVHYSNVKKVYFSNPYDSDNNEDNNNNDNNNNFVSDVSLNIYVSPSDPSDGKIHFECTASGNDDFSKGTFYLVSGAETVELVKGKSTDHYTVYNSAPDNSRSGDYRYLSKGYYYPYCKYYASDGKVFTSDFVEVVYD